MHLEQLVFESEPSGARREVSFRARGDALQRWTLLPRGADSDGLFAVIALACTGWRHAEPLSELLRPALAAAALPARAEFVLVRHAPQDCDAVQPPRRRSGWRIEPDGRLVPLRRKEARHGDPAAAFGKPPSGAGNVGRLFLAYGSRLQAHAGTDRFDFSHPHHRLRRFATLFDPQARLTDPVAFLERLHHKGVRYEKPRSRLYIARLNQELSALFEIAPDAWLSKRYDFRGLWERTPTERRPLIVVALDAARHVFDASPRLYGPFDQTGVLLLDGVEQWCPPEHFAAFMHLLDTVFPRLQFIASLADRERALLPGELLAQTLPIPQAQPCPPRLSPTHLPPGTVLLIDVDSQLPNLALMKLSRHFKAQGKQVVLAHPDTPITKADAVLASCVFAFPQSARRVAELRRRYGADLQVGGSGVDIRRRLPPEIEDLPADFSLYPALGDRAIGFLTRGCPFHCPFCIVPIKEGKPRLVSDFDTLLQGRQKLILLDDNLLSHPASIELMEEMLRRDLPVNFNQTLDVRLLTADTAGLLRRIRCSNVTFTRRNYYFSLNNARHLDLVRQRYDLLQVNGRDNVEFVCMYGFDTTLADDVERFRFLRSLPGAYVFLQRYRPVLGGPEADLSNFLDDRAEEHIDALLQVNFTQNMKSMEVYYRWLCVLYAQQHGRIHRRLVETLYRYNGRHRHGGFLARLETICRRGEECSQRTLTSSNDGFPVFAQSASRAVAV